MSFLTNEPYKIVWCSIPLIVTMSFMGGIESAIDIQMHDTYFVFALFHLGLQFSICSTIFGYLYWLLRGKKLIDWMTRVHVICTVTTFLAIMTVGVINDHSYMSMDLKLDVLISILLIFVLLTLLSQVLFILNLSISAYLNVGKH